MARIILAVRVWFRPESGRTTKLEVGILKIILKNSSWKYGWQVFGVKKLKGYLIGLAFFPSVCQENELACVNTKTWLANLNAGDATSFSCCYNLFFPVRISY